jgi:hypothetical protein
MFEITIKELQDDLAFKRLIIGNVEVSSFQIDSDTEFEVRHGNLDVIHALANWLQNNGKPKKIIDSEISDNLVELYIAENIKKLSIYHKYAKINIEFELYLRSGKVILTRIT